MPNPNLKEGPKGPSKQTTIELMAKLNELHQIRKNIEELEGKILKALAYYGQFPSC